MHMKHNKLLILSKALFNSYLGILILKNSSFPIQIIYFEKTPENDESQMEPFSENDPVPTDHGFIQDFDSMII